MTFYREDLMEHFKHPQNHGVLNTPTVSVTEKNPMCGDEVTLSIKIENDKISDIAFDGNACSVSVVASSLLTEFIKGKDLGSVKLVTKEDLLNLMEVNLTTSRIKCATLSLEALQKAIKVYESKN